MVTTQRLLMWTRSPYTRDEWKRIDALGLEVDQALKATGVGLTMGGEPTFVARDISDPQWRCTALGEEKRRLGETLLERLRRRLAPEALVLDGVGKSYPGEEAPRWALGLYWRLDGAPLWRRRQLLVEDLSDAQVGGGATAEEGGEFLRRLAGRLGVNVDRILPAYRDRRGPGGNAAALECRGHVLPLLRVSDGATPFWASCRWSMPGGRLFAESAEKPLGLNLPLHLLPPAGETGLAEEYSSESAVKPPKTPLAADTIRVALCAEVRGGRLHIFLPPMGYAENFLDLVTQVEETAADLALPVCLEGYGPPPHAELAVLQLTPDPGVLEVNIPAAEDWPQLVTLLSVVSEEAEGCGLVATRCLPDGRRVGSGGGHHITIGAGRPQDSPFLRRPDLLRSMLAYWQNHPGLSFGFVGLFVGATSQAPRPDEVRPENLAELSIALAQLGSASLSPSQLQRTLDQLLVDASGNRHRAELCIDKLWPLHRASARLGLVELRGIEMQPHVQMALAVALLLRALVACFWVRSYDEPLCFWGTALQDRFALPHFIEEDLSQVVEDLRQGGVPFEREWLRPHFDFRFPLCGRLDFAGGELELRQALEPWPVLAEDISSTAASRSVDSSCERLQVRLHGIGASPPVVLCNGRRLPLSATARDGEFVAGVRFKARPLEQSLHPLMPPHTPLRFDIREEGTGRFLGGGLYHAGSPVGGDYDGYPADAVVAAERVRERFVVLGEGRPMQEIPAARIDPQFPLTLDLRRQP